jgi:hypothetical protein
LAVVWLLLSLLVWMAVIPASMGAWELVLISIASLSAAGTIMWLTGQFWKRYKPASKKMRALIISVAILLFCFVVLPFYQLPIAGREYCCEQPVFRWKYAIYYGECFEGEGGEGNDYKKIEGTGWMEYFGLKGFECPCDGVHIEKEFNF